MGKNLFDLLLVIQQD